MDYGSEEVKAARDIGEMSLREAVNALDHCEGDVLLAVGYAQSELLAVNIRGGEEGRERWQMKRAINFKDEYIAKHGEPDMTQYEPSSAPRM